jgi:hypothetical protein
MAAGPSQWPTITLARAALATSAVGWGAAPAAERLFEIPAFCGDLLAAMFVRGETGAFLALASPMTLVFGWTLMLLAMLPPLLREPIALLWQRSLARRRLRSIGWFVAGYGSAWLLAGLALLPIAVACALAGTAMAVPGFVVALVLATIWQMSPCRRIALNRCHHQPRLSAFGLRADLDALRYGAAHASACIAACGAWMLPPLLLDDWHLPAMAAAMLLSIHERNLPLRTPRWRLPRNIGGTGPVLGAAASAP